MKSMKNTAMPVQSNNTSIQEYYYEHPQIENIICCYDDLSHNLLISWQQALGGLPWPKSKIIIVPYDKIKFTVNYTPFTLDEHLDYARQTGHFVVIDKTVEHIHDEFDFGTLHTNLKKHQLLDRCVVLDNTKDETLFEQYDVPHMYGPFYPLFYIGMSKRIPRYVAEPKHMFLCLNNYSKPHRVATISTLQKLNMLKKTSWSFREQALPTNMDYNVNKIISNWQVKDFNFESPKHLDQGADSFDQEANMAELYANSVTSIATETDYLFDKTQFATEKCYNAIFHANYLIAVSCKGTIDVLREHGLDVYDDIIDHSYDSVADPIERFQHIESAIVQHYAGSGYKQFRTTIAPRALRNQILLTTTHHWAKEIDHWGWKAYKEGSWGQ